MRSGGRGDRFRGFIRRAESGLILAAALAAASAHADEPAECGAATAADIAGTWKLVEATTTLPDGTTEHPFGDPPAGMFVYTPGGHLSLHVNRNPPPARFEQRPDDAELGAAARAYIGYYGKWSLAGDKLVHHIEGAMLPNRIGQSADRPFTVCGGVLELNITGKDGRRFYRRLERIERFAAGTSANE